MSFNIESLNTLYKLKKEILKSNNDALVSQIDHAITKTYNDQIVFSFIGHYSAGKSSLINHLLSSEILPSSPVPTTSNTVQVQISDDDNIQAFLDQYQYVQLNNYEELKSLNTKDIDIAAINMDIEHDAFKNQTVFQDTPGVDSKTDAHQETTSRFLLNSDYIFFTVEYNHVQSEQNLKLLKDISDLNIPVSLIINQVDKHDENELTINTFLSRIEQTMGEWSVNLENIFMTSIYETPNNQIEDLKSFIHSLETHRTQIQKDFYDRITKNIEKKQLEYLQDEIQRLSEPLGTSGTLTKETATEQIKFLDGEITKSNISSLHQDEEALKAHVLESVKKIVKDSYIFPHTVKTAVTEYLKVRAGEVKITGLFGKKKKEAVLLNNTLEDIENNFKSVIDTEVNAPINSFFGNIGLTGEPFKYKWTNNILEEPVIQTLSNQFILNYLDKLKSALVKDVSKKAVAHLSNLEFTDREAAKDKNSLISERDSYQAILDSLMLVESIDTANYRHFYIHMDDEIEKLDLTEEVTLELKDSSKEKKVRNEEFRVEYEEKTNLAPIYETKKLIESVSRYEDFNTIIEEKLNRLNEGKAKISVFGGFSAGKTTFINALMGEDTLTTSPNPTTATITEINNLDSSVVTYKNKEDLIETLSTLSNLNYSEIGDYTKWIKKNINQVPETYKPFLNGILNHFPSYESSLGQSLEIPTDELIEKISTDEDATFIHKASISLKNELTKNYNIVDSPGINSINQRHTKETRNIIADSDLVIYVSYYNHVFSRSDESFLKYIKSIKGQDFPIIFIINAIDLMRNQSDKDKVVEYMSDALIHMEINHVIYPVSSKQALKTEDEGFNAAKNNIIKIAEDHAKNVQYQTLVETVSQLTHRVKSNIRQFENKESEQTKLISHRETLKTALDQLSIFTVKPKLSQEIDVVLTFIKKRFELKLYDYLKGLVTSNDASDKDYLIKNQAIISQNINDFLTLEVSTVFNAIYRFADESVTQLISEYNEELKKANTVHTLTFEKIDGKEPKVTIDSAHFKEISRSLYQARNNTRQFRDTLLKFSSLLIQSINIEKLEQDMNALINEYLETLENHLKDEIKIIREELETPLPEVKESDYKEDIKLIEALTRIKEGHNDSE